jgi:hypothetical protein
MYIDMHTIKNPEQNSACESKMTRGRRIEWIGRVFIPRPTPAPQGSKKQGLYMAPAKVVKIYGFY